MDNSLLRFITCGSVDDGKSTLIGHMLYDAKLIFSDQKQALMLASKAGSADGRIDYSLLLDGLSAEREQGITIDVAYRYFSTERRSFIVADCPGHEEYTRNMAVGASNADAAVILVDASKGISRQTHRHIRICALMGIKSYIFTINKMDLIGYDRSTFDKIEKSLRAELSDIPCDEVYFIPVSATEGDNIMHPSSNTDWYEGRPLLSTLEIIHTQKKKYSGFLMPVQRVCRPNLSFRGFEGEIKRGAIETGDEITVLPSGEKAGIKEILAAGKAVTRAEAGWPVTIALDREIDVSRGCMMIKNFTPECGREWMAKLLWMDERKLVGGRNYILILSTQTVPATVSEIVYRINVDTGEKEHCREIQKNELAFVYIRASENLVFSPFKDDRELGSFLLIDKLTNFTAACGVIEKKKSGSRHLVSQKTDIDRSMREAALDQKARTFWFTGLSGAGKSAIGNALEKRLHSMGYHTMLLDGDNIRMGLNSDLEFTEADRAENIRRVAEVAKLLNDAGIIVITTFISPLRIDRQRAREIIGDAFFEIYVNTPIEVCEKRDVKGLYKKARSGEIEFFTGITSPYEPPKRADAVLDTGSSDIEENVDFIIETGKERGFL